MNNVIRLYPGKPKDPQLVLIELALFKQQLQAQIDTLTAKVAEIEAELKELVEAGR